MRFRFWTIGAALAATLFAAAFAAGYANPAAPAGGAFDDLNRGRALAPLGSERECERYSGLPSKWR
ncbi:formylglycine-generating enzyme family protein, partial [Burkholderia cenocepacia]|nr:formylglycine-generating enzyme family protein [Burkholderia cenocepacia]MDR5668073.1 formylglycine-generating enzyme family protein [Burkholderia cenocepacia]